MLTFFTSEASHKGLQILIWIFSNVFFRSAKDAKSLCLPTTGQIYGTMFGSVWPHLLWIAVNQQHIIGVNPRDHDTTRDLAHSPTPVKVSLGASQLPRSGCRPPLWALVKYRGIILSKGIGLHSLADCSIHPRAS